MSSALSTTSAQCLHNNGWSMVSMRAYRSSGSVDTNTCTTLKNAKSAGIPQRDAYLFPCPTCSKSAATQVSETISHLQGCGTGVWNGKLWLDIEGSNYWTGSTSSNRSWYQSLVTACKSHAGVTCGVYSSYYQWQSIFGSTTYCYGYDMPMWYAHYDNVANFSDYKEYGCWAHPYAKQYAGNVSLCSAYVDENHIES